MKGNLSKKKMTVTTFYTFLFFFSIAWIKTAITSPTCNSIRIVHITANLLPVWIWRRSGGPCFATAESIWWLINFWYTATECGFQRYKNQLGKGQGWCHVNRKVFWTGNNHTPIFIVIKNQVNVEKTCYFTFLNCWCLRGLFWIM